MPARRRGILLSCRTFPTGANYSTVPTIRRRRVAATGPIATSAALSSSRPGRPPASPGHAVAPWARGGSGVLLDDELARAVRQESAAAVGHWWGVHSGVVWRWRTVLKVDLVNNPGTHQLVQAAAQAGAEAMKAKE